MQTLQALFFFPLPLPSASPSHFSFLPISFRHSSFLSFSSSCSPSSSLAFLSIISPFCHSRFPCATIPRSPCGGNKSNRIDHLPFFLWVFVSITFFSPIRVPFIPSAPFFVFSSPSTRRTTPSSLHFLSRVLIRVTYMWTGGGGCARTMKRTTIKPPV